MVDQPLKYRLKRSLRCLAETYRPIGPTLAATGTLLRRNAGALAILLAACVIGLTAARVAIDVWSLEQMRAETRGMERSMALVPPNLPTSAIRPYVMAAFEEHLRGSSFELASTRSAVFVSAGFFVVVLYLWTSIRAGPATAKVRMRGSTIRTSVAVVAIAFAPGLAFCFADVGARLLFGLGFIGPGYKPTAVDLRHAVSAFWLLVAAPFVLPALPIALWSSAPFTEAAHFGRDRFLELVALTAIIAGLPVAAGEAIASLAGASLVSFLTTALDRTIGYALYDALLNTLYLTAAMMTALGFVTAVRPPSSELSR